MLVKSHLGMFNHNIYYVKQHVELMDIFIYLKVKNVNLNIRYKEKQVILMYIYTYTKETQIYLTEI